MTDSRANVVIPYVRFLECQERRRRIAPALTRRDRILTIDAKVVPVGGDALEPTVGKPPYGSVVDVLEKPRMFNGDHDEAQASH
jgi:hypothetical protein